MLTNSQNRICYPEFLRIMINDVKKSQKKVFEIMMVGIWEDVDFSYLERFHYFRRNYNYNSYHFY